MIVFQMNLIEQRGGIGPTSTLQADRLETSVDIEHGHARCSSVVQHPFFEGEEIGEGEEKLEDFAFQFLLPRFHLFHEPIQIEVWLRTFDLVDHEVFDDRQVLAVDVRVDQLVLVQVGIELVRVFAEKRLLNGTEFLIHDQVFDQSDRSVELDGFRIGTLVRGEGFIRFVPVVEVQINRRSCHDLKCTRESVNHADKQHDEMCRQEFFVPPLSTDDVR